jgi:hypothetical protein
MGKFCTIAGRPVNKGRGVLQMSGSKLAPGLWFGDEKAKCGAFY